MQDYLLTFFIKIVIKLYGDIMVNVVIYLANYRSILIGFFPTFEFYANIFCSTAHNELLNYFANYVFSLY